MDADQGTPIHSSGAAPIKPRTATDIDLLIGKQLRQLRRRLGVKQAELSRSVGISYPQMQKYEIGENRITVAMLFRICVALNVRPVDFMTLLSADIAARKSRGTLDAPPPTRS
jgi:transcriptional regulator with XRE-family HTH domain